MPDRIANLLAFLEESPDDPFLLFALAQEYTGNGDLRHAKEHYVKLLHNHPNYVATYYHLGKLHESEGRAEEAAEVYRQGIVIAREQGDVHAMQELMGALQNVG